MTLKSHLWRENVIILSLCAHYVTLLNIYESVREISNNVVCATGKASDQLAHTRSLIRAFAIC